VFHQLYRVSPDLGTLKAWPSAEKGMYLRNLFYSGTLIHTAHSPPRDRITLAVGGGWLMTAYDAKLPMPVTVRPGQRK
jgi:hypothetical protein